jgi:hypothetical protein
MKYDYLIIYGKTLEGKILRPGNWPERLAAKLINCEEKDFEKFVYPTYKDGAKALAVSSLLKSFDPILYKEILIFAKNQNLVTQKLS